MAVFHSLDFQDCIIMYVHSKNIHQNGAIWKESGPIKKCPNNNNNKSNFMNDLLSSFALIPV